MTGLDGQSVRTLHGEPIGVWEADDGGKRRAPICFVWSGVSGGGQRGCSERGGPVRNARRLIRLFFMRLLHPLSNVAGVTGIACLNL